MHGSSGVRNAKLGLIRYLSWIIIGCPQDTPVAYAKYASMAAALEQLFNHGKGTPEQRLRAAMWLADAEVEPANRKRRSTQSLIQDTEV